MKTLILLLITSLGVQVLSAQNSKFTINGDITSLKAPAEWVILSYYINDRHITDSAPVRQGSYVFGGHIAEPVLARLSVRFKANADGNRMPVNSQRDYASIFLQCGTLNVV